MKNLRYLLGLVVLSTLTFPAMSAPKPLNVLATLHPLALIAASTVPLEQLEVLVPAGMTPHDFSLRPSDIDRLQNADIIFWAGPEAEPYLRGFAKRWPDKHWINLAIYRQEGQSDDPHVWFSTVIALAAQADLAALLGHDNSEFAQSVAASVQFSEEQLQGLQQRGFFVFHRAYDHWVSERGLLQLGAFTLSPEQKPGIRTLQAMRDQLANGEVVCVFSEPEYTPALVDSVVGDLPVNRAELDPLGSHISVTKDGYARFLDDMAMRARACLEPREN